MSSSSFGAFHSPFHGQAETFLHHGSLSDRTHKPTAPSYPTQIGSIRTNVEMGHRVEKQWWTLHVDGASRSRIQREYEANDERMACYLAMVESRLEKLDEWVIRRVPCEENGKADALVRIVATLPMKEATREIPGDEKQAHKLRIQAACFALINDQLYRWSFGGPYLKCLSEPNAKYVLFKLHEGVCGNHLGEQTLAHRAYMQGYAPIPRDLQKCSTRSKSLVVCTMKDGHNRVPAHCNSRKEVFARCNRLLQQLGGGFYASIKDKDVSKFI
ncbi:hypothetical protein CK203_107484 [Vitis vinifera]|uniref:RNase H type-1 domain-containing protein n=1 Tax=Vitis vinifera TaxID=29760 RepID=A0A438CIS5_VITVI|nr:hypothetical protein CK203_107484 [Vitis vinifera]